jgi:hypothetical protein
VIKVEFKPRHGRIKEQTTSTGDKEMICDNCCIAEEDIEVNHRCRRKETSCIDGQDCPDYIAECDCKECKTKENL